MSGKTYILGTRSSPLAMWQAQFVQWLLEEQWPEDHFTILGIKTTGDDQTISISKSGGKAVYVKELEEALIERKVDFCVHSLKDYPVNPFENCSLAAVVERGEVRDVLVSREKKLLKDFTRGMRIGTSSLRRKALLRSQSISSEVVEIRGNVETRLRKVKDGEVDGVILAAAGLLRLGLENEVTEYFDPRLFLPPPGQGAIAVECRTDNEDMRLKLRRIHHDESGQATEAERAFLRALGGSCSLPLGAWCEVEQFQMRLHAFL
ncbi:MAG: Porphobilinogen deaminase, partial [Bacteriovoracaceae bacterium]|nr:Porphobilinogen deaminase [Bacteriovoracaceae bacterium]